MEAGGSAILPAMVSRASDPRTEDTIAFELLRTARGAQDPEVVGRATFRDGRSSVDAPDAVRIAVNELLEQAFVDRVEADERPRGYRRSGQRSVEMLVPGMAEHFVARLRGLWLPYPDGSVVTARAALPASPEGPRHLAAADLGESGPSVVDPSVRRATLSEVAEILHVGPLVRDNRPESGVRPPSERGDVSRTDCGWLV
jgi:hypothetical protein